jgi:hypothetical protein
MADEQVAVLKESRHALRECLGLAVQPAARRGVLGAARGQRWRLGRQLFPEAGEDTQDRLPPRGPCFPGY